MTRRGIGGGLWFVVCERTKSAAMREVSKLRLSGWLAMGPLRKKLNVDLPWRRAMFLPWRATTEPMLEMEFVTRDEFRAITEGKGRA